VFYVFRAALNTRRTGTAIPKRLFLIGDIFSLAVEGIIDKFTNIKMRRYRGYGTTPCAFTALYAGEQRLSFNMR
jgi:hypothetical protein